MMRFKEWMTESQRFVEGNTYKFLGTPNGKIFWGNGQMHDAHAEIWRREAQAYVVSKWPDRATTWEESMCRGRMTYMGIPSINLIDLWWFGSNADACAAAIGTLIREGLITPETLVMTAGDERETFTAQKVIAMGHDPVANQPTQAGQARRIADAEKMMAQKGVDPNMGRYAAHGHERDPENAGRPPAQRRPTRLTWSQAMQKTPWGYTKQSDSVIHFGRII